MDVSIPAGKKYYLPHHPILTPAKETTKIHIVYNASAKGCLYRGPIILPDLCGLLMRFRLHILVILADVEKAVTLYGKLFLQKLWKIDQTWDKPLSEELLKEWNQIALILGKISSLRIPRFVETSREINRLLIFSDASVKCYAAAVYLQCITGNSSKTNLVFAKTRLVPVNKRKNKCKKWTIPRLELLAVLIRVRAANFVAAKLKVPIIERILWTDSQCVLHWLKTRKPLPIFVEIVLKK